MTSTYFCDVYYDIKDDEEFGEDYYLCTKFRFTNEDIAKQFVERISDNPYLSSPGVFMSEDINDYLMSRPVYAILEEALWDALDFFEHGDWDKDYRYAKDVIQHYGPIQGT